MIEIELPDQIAHGFLSVSGLHDLGVGMVLCYQEGKFHTGFTLSSPDEDSIVYVQMYQLPKGVKKLEDDLTFENDQKSWGKPPKNDALQLKIFPADWTHSAFSPSPRRIVHQYRRKDRAVFIRYVGESLKDPMFTGFNKNLRYLPGEWHTKLVDHELLIPDEPDDADESPTETITSVDLREEQSVLRKMILDGVKRFAKEQLKKGSDVYKLPVSGIVFWLDVGNGSASVHFDVRTPFENDGSYSHQEYASIHRENWLQITESHVDGEVVTLTGLKGKATRIKPDSDFNFDKTFGKMLLELIQSLRTEKAFAPLLLAPKAEFIIESEGDFCWPTRYEDRGKKNLL